MQPGRLSGHTETFSAPGYAGYADLQTLPPFFFTFDFVSCDARHGIAYTTEQLLPSQSFSHGLLHEWLGRILPYYMPFQTAISANRWALLDSLVRDEGEGVGGGEHATNIKEHRTKNGVLRADQREWVLPRPSARAARAARAARTARAHRHHLASPPDLT